MVGVILGSSSSRKQLQPQLVTSDTMTVERFVEVGDNSGTDVMVPNQSAIVNTLDAGAHSSENAKFVSSKRKLFTLNIRHFQFQVFDQVVVNQGSWWSGKE